MLKVSVILYLLSDIACASNFELSENESEFNNVSVKERVRLYDVNKQNSEMPQNTLEDSRMLTDARIMQGSKSSSKVLANASYSQKLGARPVSSKNHHEFIDLNSQHNTKANRSNTGETSFTCENERSDYNTKSSGAIPKQTNKNSITIKAEVHKQQQSSQTSENSAENDESPQNTRKLNEITVIRSPDDTTKTESRSQKKCNVGKNEKYRVSKKCRQLKNYKKEEDDVGKVTSFIFNILDAVF